MHKRFLALSILLTVSGVRAMETEIMEGKEKPPKISLFNQMIEGLLATPEDFSKFCEKFKEQLNDGTIDPNETLGNTGVPALDVLAEIYTFNTNEYTLIHWDDGLQRARWMKCTGKVAHAREIYKLLVNSIPVGKEEVKHTYEARPVMLSDLWVLAQREEECEEHSCFIERIKDKETDDDVLWLPLAGPFFNLKNVTHSQVLEMLLCKKKHPTTRNRKNWLNNLNELKNIYDEPKLSATAAAKLIMLCMKVASDDKKIPFSVDKGTIKLFGEMAYNGEIQLDLQTTTKHKNEGNILSRLKNIYSNLLSS